MDTLTLERLAEWRGFELHRGRYGGRVWLIRDGQLFSPRRGTDEATARMILAPGG
jgi:hypothetical protein